MSRVSINIVTWNGEKYIENCLRSVMNQTFQDYTIIIIDNGSSDQTLELINERYPHLKIIKHRENHGFAKGHNQAVHWTKSDYVLVLNQDIVLDPDYLQHAVALLDSNKLIGSVAGKLYRLQDGAKTKYIDSLGLKVMKNFRVVELGAGEVDEGQSSVREEVFGISGAAAIYRRKALEEVQYQQEYFDELFFAYKEDVDIAFRLRLAGWQSWMDPEAIAYHDRTVGAEHNKETKIQVMKSRKRKSKFANFHSYRNHLYFLQKCVPKLYPQVFFYEFAKFFYILLLEPSTLRAWKDFFHNRKQMKLKRQVAWKNKKIKIEELTQWFNK
jgi:GT2 family glycosyltransferase